MSPAPALKKKTPVAIKLAVVLAGLLVLALAGYFLVILPKKHEVKSLSQQITQLDQQISDARVQATQAARTVEDPRRQLLQASDGDAERSRGGRALAATLLGGSSHRDSVRSDPTRNCRRRDRLPGDTDHSDLPGQLLRSLRLPLSPAGPGARREPQVERQGAPLHRRSGFFSRGRQRLPPDQGHACGRRLHLRSSRGDRVEHDPGGADHDVHVDEPNYDNDLSRREPTISPREGGRA